MELQVIETKDRTITNPAEAVRPTVSIREEKAWAALVWRDLSKPGGLDRDFLDSRERGHRILVEKVQAGQFIEFAHEFSAWSVKRSTRDRVYWLVHAVEPGRLIVEEVAKKAILPRDSNPALVDDAGMAITLGLTKENESLKARVEQLEDVVAKTKTILNRVTRKTRQRKIEMEEVEAELSEALQHLRGKREDDVVMSYPKTVSQNDIIGL